jgi:hypothetical protein
MHFTLVFNDLSMEGPSIAVNLVFHPCATWRIGDWELVANPRIPEYCSGFVHELEVRDGGLLMRFRSNRFDSQASDMMVTVICHPNGHGTENDLEVLLDDLRAYKVRVVRSDK